MNTYDTRNRYHPLSIGAHWLTLILLIAVYALTELRDIYPKGSETREAMKIWHSMLGLSVFVIVFVRLALRYFFRAPPVKPSPTAWQQFLATAMHVTLYAFLIVVPLLGWFILSAKGKPVPFFGLELPVLIGQDKALGKNIEEIHKTIGNIGYCLIGLHALAGVYHYYFMHDNALHRMSPWKSKH